ncbi:MAG: UDP-N-acetylglucosamine--N-acetylmuramyl-(pentapeptide) pyrophosphoryl-undecaprenol N-acetylglucosamine transferase [Candidatus Dojkabacteria bacterium]|nr:MAG: UDP-N-acetylglucosamine--N-acetylmuramyl-(pentapeptide) pyrophosphoryl-undecaprenol N-acetylglucosamine transferase [Candidatus Dojkabacteria bacterium]
MQSSNSNRPSSTLTKRILITGGGSGGHISAATAIIDGLKGRYSNATEQILYVGGKLGMEGEKNGTSLEQRIFKDSDIKFVAIRAGKLQRYLSWNSIKLLLGVFGGVIDARKVIKEYKPDIVISTGGYVTVPVCFIAWLNKIPVYIHEQTAAVGLTNKTTSKFARRIYTSFPSSEQYFPRKKVLHVGNAVREKVFMTDGQGEVVDAVRDMQQDRSKLPILLFTGGGQGSHKLNITVRQMVPYIVEEFQVIIQTGQNELNKDYDLLLKERAKLTDEKKRRFFPVKYIDADQIGYLFDNIDMHIGRAGANFVYEMGVLKIPSIFIPLPFVTHNEQEKNAQTLVQFGIAKILPEGELTSERLFNEIKKFNSEIKKGLTVDTAGLESTFRTDAVEKILADLDL